MGQSMTEQNPITPPPELVDQWATEACPECHLSYDEFTGESVEILATRAAQWGADQELEACCHYFARDLRESLALELRAARRPKPPSLKEQSLALIDLIQGNEKAWDIRDLDVVRRALEAMPDD